MSHKLRISPSGPIVTGPAGYVLTTQADGGVEFQPGGGSGASISTTLTASFTQPAIGDTVIASVGDGTIFSSARSDNVFIGRDLGEGTIGGWYRVEAATAVTITIRLLKALTAPGGSVTNGSSVIYNGVNTVVADYDAGISRAIPRTGDSSQDLEYVGPTIEDDGRIGNVSTPINPTDVATKGYVDSIYFAEWAALSAPAINADRYMQAGAYSSPVSSSAQASIHLAPVSTTIRTLRIFQSATLATDTLVYTLQINGVDTAATVTILPTAVSGTWTGTVSVNAGDRYTLKLRQNGTEASAAMNPRAVISAAA